MGPGTDTHGTPMPQREGRGWPATRSTVRQTCTTRRQTPLSLTTYRLFLTENVDDIKLTGKKQNKAPMWKKLMKHVDLDEPTSFLDRVYLGRAQRECKPNEVIIEEYTKVLESRISAGATEKLPGWEKPHAKTRAWFYDMEGHARK